MKNETYNMNDRTLRARDDSLASGTRFRRFKRAGHADHGDPAKAAEESADQNGTAFDAEASEEVTAIRPEDWMDEVRAQTAPLRNQTPASRTRREPDGRAHVQRKKAAPMPLEDPVYLPEHEDEDEAFARSLSRAVSMPDSHDQASPGMDWDDAHLATANLPAVAHDVWRHLPLVRSNLSPELLGHATGVISPLRDDPAARAFDLLRTRLVSTLKANGWRRVAVAAPTTGCGSTFVALNLALSLSRMPHSRTVLMDLNQRNPDLGPMIGVRGAADAHHLLRGQVEPEDYFLRVSDQLAVGVSDNVYPDASDLLHNPLCAVSLERMQKQLSPDVVVYDLPPILALDDLAAFLPQVDGVLLVSDGTKTTARHIADCERILRGQTELLGVVLNKARKSEAAASAA